VSPSPLTHPAGCARSPPDVRGPTHHVRSNHRRTISSIATSHALRLSKRHCLD
jgi:hypothetical protein